MDDFLLQELSDPDHFQEPISIENIDSDTLIRYLNGMLRIRYAERRLARGKKEGDIGGPVHLGVGQEAIAVGISGNLRKTDRIFGAHRSHSHVLSMGADLYRLFAEVLGKDDGLSRGMGGSMHLWDQANGFYGSVPIVSGTVPLAVGAALAAKLQNTEDVGVIYLGDGAVEEGVVHESLNLARVMGVPVLFVVENNLFASHMHISLRQPKYATARFAVANDMLYEIVDGNDVVKMHQTSKNLISYARTNSMPVFLEAVTYRWYGHVDWREDIDVGVNRSEEEVAAWRKRDPVARLVCAMLARGVYSEDDIESLELRIEKETEIAWQQAKESHYPPHSALLGRVYASKMYD